MYENLAIVGATGAVGRLIRQLLEERKFPYKTIKFLASKRSAGTEITFNGTTHTVEELMPDSFEGVDIAIGSTPDDAAAEFAPWAVKAGCIVVDESGYWRMKDDVPLVVPEVNPEAIQNHKGIFLGVPCQLGEGGLQRIIEVELTESEVEALTNSARAVRETIDAL